MTNGTILGAIGALMLVGCATQEPVSKSGAGTENRVRVVQRGMGSAVEFVACTECASTTRKVIDLPPPQIARRDDIRPAPVPMANRNDEPTRKAFAVHFEVGRADLDRQGLMELDAAASALKGMTGTVSIFGRADPTGPVALNSKLALRRAEAVRDALRAAGVGSASIMAARREPCCDGERKASADVLRSLRRADVEIVFKPKG